jgi:hypothetical protein
MPNARSPQGHDDNDMLSVAGGQPRTSSGADRGAGAGIRSHQLANGERFHRAGTAADAGRSQLTTLPPAHTAAAPDASSFGHPFA